MTKFLLRIIPSGIACLLGLVVWQAPVFAQANPAPANTQPVTRDDKTPPTPPAASATKDDGTAKASNSAANAEIIAELERMRLRIQELEARLKEQGGDAPTPNSAAPPVLGSNAAATPAGASATLSNTAATPPTVTADSSTPPAAPPVVSGATPVGAPATLQSDQAKPAKAEPWAFADFTWMNGNARTKDLAADSKFFTPEIRADVSYIYDFNHPIDHTIGGSTEVFRSGEVQLDQLGIGGDFHFDNVRARFMTQFGLYSETTPRNDASPSVGQWNLNDAYRYISEAYGGYHFDYLNGVNIDAGIFMSYIGLFSYYNFDNWAYQPSYVSSNTPWFFNGMRAQVFVTNKLKIEPWFINGWQSYGRPNGHPGVGGQIRWSPTGWFTLISNNYGLGSDDVGFTKRQRIHTDDSIEVKYFDRPDNLLDKMAATFTVDAGCEYGEGVSCHGDGPGGPKQSFLGAMLYNRFWFHKDTYAVTLGGGAINNPGRYLVLLPPINGATASSGTPYFTTNPGDPFKAWDASATFDYMPKQYITFRWEYDYRASNVPYFTGTGGLTPQSCPTPVIDNNICGSPGALVPGFTPDLRKSQATINMAILVKF